MYVGRVNWLIIECRVMENSSSGGDIYDKVVGIVDGAGGARGSIGGANSSNDSPDLEDGIRPKNKA